MKQTLLLLLIALPLIFTSCSKDDEPTEQTFFVNVYTKYGNSDKELADKAWLFLFKDNGKTIDYTKTASSIVLDEKITYSDGSTQSYEYSKSAPGVFNLEKIPNGNYILLVSYSNYNVGYCSCKKITVDYNYRGKKEEKTFSLDNSTGALFNYQEW